MPSNTTLHLSLLQTIIFFFFLLAPPVVPSHFTPKHGCIDRCGNISIPYPFGVGPDCSLDPSFNIICNTLTEPPKPYLSIYDHMEVVEIKPSQVRVKNPYLLGLACYDKLGNESPSSAATWTGISLQGTQYTFSNENLLTAIGCDDLVLGIGEGNQRFGGGCVSYCKNSSDSHDFGFCPNDDMENQASYGCCRNPIPKGISMLGVEFIDLSSKWRNGKLFPCSYAFIMEKGGFINQSQELGLSYPLSYLSNSTSFVDDNWLAKGIVPVVRLDWRISNENCAQAQHNLTNYACRDNTYCVDFDVDVNGYLCLCKDGYRGNPYLKCQDINECVDNPCDSNSVCINTPGSFVCSCPNLYYGDGRREGRGCIPSRIIYVFLGVFSGLGFLLLLSLFLLWHNKLQNRKKKRRKEKFFEKNGGLLLQNHTNEGLQMKAKLFAMEELEKATDNFNKSRIIGQGGQGRVYKGMLSNGNIVAIKKSNLINKVQLEQFINEVVILSQINHRNVVKLLGCCLETEVPLLVYELMPNGTLFDLIHDPTSEFPLSWNMRLKMAADIAGAIMYLHSASSSPIYHRDIKTRNILLDEKYVVKLSDFGISVLVADDQTHLTTMAKGTIGYCDPEYFRSHQFTEKSDVYSFGVVLLELLTGQRPVALESMEERSLVIRFLDSMQENNLEGILDSRVLEESVRKEMIAVAIVAHRCLSLSGKMRPTMKEVATNLESLRMMHANASATIDEEIAVDRAKSLKISITEYTWAEADSMISEASSSLSNNEKATTTPPNSFLLF